MSPELTAVFEAAQALPLEERRELAERILDELEDEAPLMKEEWWAAWLPELDRRKADYLSGKSKAIPGDEVFARLREKYP